MAHASQLVLLALACCAGTVLCTKTWYGDPYRHPSSYDDWFKSYFTTAENDPQSPILAMGVVWTVGMLNKASSLPMTSVNLPTINPDLPFPFKGIEVPLDFKRPANLSLTFPFVTVTYAESGYSVGGNAPSFLGVYSTPLWSLRFHFDEQANWYGYWNQSHLAGDCFGLNQSTFNTTFKGVPKACFPNGVNYTAFDGTTKLTYAQAGDAVLGLGSRLFDFTAPEWQPNPGHIFDKTFVYGQFNGTIAYYNPMVSADFITKNQGRDFICHQIKYAPNAFPVDLELPTQFCTKIVNGLTVVLEMRAWEYVPAGNCGPDADTAKQSYYPATFRPGPWGPTCTVPAYEPPTVLPSPTPGPSPMGSPAPEKSPKPAASPSPDKSPKPGSKSPAPGTMSPAPGTMSPAPGTASPAMSPAPGTASPSPSPAYSAGHNVSPPSYGEGHNVDQSPKPEGSPAGSSHPPTYGEPSPDTKGRSGKLLRSLA